MITIEQFTELAHRTASRYSHRSEPARAFYTFSPEALAEFHRQVLATALGEPTRPANSQEWAGMDASTAFLLIQRHADGWADVELMLNEWRTANPPAPAQQEPDCPRCKGSGEDPEGYFDTSRGPDGDTYDGPCRDCAGTGTAQHHHGIKEQT